MVFNNSRLFSNFKPLSDDENENLNERERKIYTPYDPEKPEPEIDPQDF